MQVFAVVNDKDITVSFRNVNGGIIIKWDRKVFRSQNT